MSRPFDAYDGIACAEIGIYCIYLCGAIYLCHKHGFTTSSGWRYLIILSLARLIGDSMRLATISQPTNKNLYIGWLILLGVGLGPLILSLHGILGLLIDSMNTQGRVLIKSFYRHLLELLMLGGIILGIVGGIQSHFSINQGNPVTHYSTLSYVGSGIIVAVMGLLLLECLIVFRNRDCIVQSENRVLTAVIICIPFVLVRLAYSWILVFGGVHSSPWLLLGMSTAMEVIVTFICEVIGFGLPTNNSFEASLSRDQEMEPMASYRISK
jgi:hypothetical protein